ncbi:hypothetical protein GEV33_010648 [Tenebrio molitor]|uniref:Uncharacterized protein n=1 Tax=Tenebrio molitor TaxID=7067 RepID=A0A8J6HCW4_TENMO|nr:hypothetical protein GEV33_010648 [Tenebrio molitor]
MFAKIARRKIVEFGPDRDNELNIHHYDEALAVWGVANENEIPTMPQFQKNWDNINIKGIIANDLIFNSPRDLARFKALQCRESGSWLHAIPSPNIGTLLDNTSFQVCIGLRLGCNLCTPHICKCNAKVDEIGTHGLSCFKSSGRFSRHTEINSIINRSLTSIHVNSTLEPHGLSRDDGKRPDGMTLVPRIKGQPLVWDVTVVDTLADSYVLKSSEVSGFAAEMACKRKHSKYSSIISSNYVFKGLAFETLGTWCKEAIDFINVIGNRFIAESGDSKSKKFLFERISLAIQLYIFFTIPVPTLAAIHLLADKDVDLTQVYDSSLFQLGCFIFKLVPFVFNVDNVRDSIYMLELPIFNNYTTEQEKILEKKSEPRRRGADLRIPDGRFAENQTPECGVRFHARISSSTVGPRKSPRNVQVSRDVDRPVRIKARVIE